MNEQHLFNQKDICSRCGMSRSYYGFYKSPCKYDKYEYKNGDKIRIVDDSELNIDQLPKGIPITSILKNSYQSELQVVAKLLNSTIRGKYYFEINDDLHAQVDKMVKKFCWIGGHGLTNKLLRDYPKSYSEVIYTIAEKSGVVNLFDISPSDDLYDFIEDNEDSVDLLEIAIVLNSINKACISNPSLNDKIKEIFQEHGIEVNDFCRICKNDFTGLTKVIVNNHLLSYTLSFYVSSGILNDVLKDEIAPKKPESIINSFFVGSAMSSSSAVSHCILHNILLQNSSKMAAHLFFKGHFAMSAKLVNFAHTSHAFTLKAMSEIALKKGAVGGIKGVALCSKGLIGKGVGFITGPIGWAIIGTWIAFDIVGPSFKLLFPSVFYFTYLRHQYYFRMQAQIEANKLKNNM